MSNQSALASAPIALVTGATSGIGREIVRDLARTHVVYAVGRDPERLAELNIRRRWSWVSLTNGPSCESCRKSYWSSLPVRVIHGATVGVKVRWVHS